MRGALLHGNVQGKASCACPNLSWLGRAIRASSIPPPSPFYPAWCGPVARSECACILYSMDYTKNVASKVPFSQVKKLLEARGYRLTRISGSHHVFTKAGARALPIPVHHGQVKPGYVRMVWKLES